MPELTAGTLLVNRFSIVAVAGQGGMGTVYQARDLTTGRSVALKLLYRDSRANQAERFLREAHVLAELHHPGIVRYVAHGQTSEGHPYLAMEWLDGEDLEQRLHRQRLTLAEALRLIELVAQALSYAHGRGIVHRDIKPSNLFLRKGLIEQATLLDFGIARFLREGDSTQLTATGAIIGTPQYMAPEQARGAHDVGPAADVFSLGCIFFECLAGQPPFSGSHVPAVLAKILFEDPPRLRLLRPDLPPRVCGLLDRMLMKEPKLRPADATALLSEIEGLRTDLGSPTAAAVPQTPGRETSPAQALTRNEQQWVSVLVAVPVDAEKDGLGTLLPEELSSQEAMQSGLVSALQGLGAQAEWLVDGSLVATFAQCGDANDQAALAARGALLVKARWSGAMVAIATGRGVLASALSMERIPLGEALDRAAMLVRSGGKESGSDPGANRTGVRLDSVTAGLLDARFFVERTELGLLILEGEQSTLDESRPLLGQSTPCVGREQELRLLQTLWESCLEAPGARVALVTAPAGVGKSRLRHEWVRRLTSKSAIPTPTLLFGRGDPMRAGAAYGLIGQALRRLFGVDEGQRLSARQAAIESYIREHTASADPRQLADFLGELCGVPFLDEGNAPLRAAREDPQLLSERITGAFIELLRALGEHGPILLILEDLHFGDRPTLRLLEAAVQELADLPLLVLALARPEIAETHKNLFGSSSVHELRLAGLPKKASERLVQHVLGKQIDEQTLSRIVERAAGNALFLEELIRATAEKKGEDTPETVLAMLQSRLQRLSTEERRLLRGASIFGETFWYGGVAALLAQTDARADISRRLQSLVAAEVIVRHRLSLFPGETEYGFRHALLRDAAYSLLTDSDRAAGHRLAAAWLEEKPAEDPAAIAEHYYRAGEPTRALPCFVRAAQLSYERYDTDELLRRLQKALACGAAGESLGAVRALQFLAGLWGWTAMDRTLQHGDEAIERLPEGSPRWCSVIGGLGALLCMSGQAARAIQLADKLVSIHPSSELAFSYIQAAMFFLAAFCQTAQFDPARRIMQRMQEVVADAQDRRPDLMAPYYHAQAEFLRSVAPSPWQHVALADESLRAYERMGDLRHVCSVLFVKGQNLTELGAIASGEVALRESVALAQRLKQPFLLSQARLHLAAALASRKEEGLREEAMRSCEELLGSPGIRPGFRGWAHSIRARALLLHGDARAAEAEARKGIELSASVPLRLLLAIADLCHALLHQSRAEDARSLAEEALSRLTKLGGAGYSELPVRLALAEARHAAGDSVGAAQALRSAAEELHRRAELIPDPAVRAHYLTTVPEHARIRELCSAWDVAASG